MGREIIVGIVFDAVATMDAIGDSEGIKKNRVASELGEVFGRIVNEKVTVIGMLKIHYRSFDETLAAPDGLSNNTNSMFVFGGGGILLKNTDGSLQLVKVAISILVNIFAFDRSLFCHLVIY